jgi:outer membrane protein assembly factor BamB
MHGFAAVAIDSGDVFQQKIENTAMDLYLTGYSLDPKVNYRSIGGAVDYSVGSVSATNGSSIVNGTGTSWRGANRGRGDRIRIDLVDYVILSVDSETQLTLTSPFTGTTGSLKPYTISRQYSTLPAWEDCVDGGPCSFFPVASANLVADDRFEVGVVYNDGLFTAGVVIEGALTDGSHRIVLTAADGSRHLGAAGIGAVIRPIVASPAVDVRDDFVTVEWLELSGVSGGTTGVAVSGLGTANHVVVRNNVIHDMSVDGLSNSSSTTKLDFYDNVLYAMAGSGVRLTQPLAQGRLFNNTVFDCGSSGFQGAGGTATVLKNNLAHSNLPSDYTMVSISSTSSNNLAGDATGVSHSPAGFGLDNVALASLQFVSTVPGAEDLHLVSGSIAQGRGETLTWLFRDDVDGALRTTPWDAGADEVGSLGGVPSISSAANQIFTTGSPAQTAATITIGEDPLSATVTALGDIRIRVPAGFHMRWDETVTTVALGGSASSRVALDVKAYEDFGQTLVLDVLADFLPAENLVVSGLRFLSFTAPSPPDFLELELDNDGIASAFDTRSIEVRANGNVTLSSERDQRFTVGSPPRLGETIFVTDGTPAAFINPTGDIRIIIPGTLAMEWDSLVGSVSLSGPAAAKVDPNPVYETLDTVRFDVTASFVAGEFVVISGLQFKNFTAISTPSSLSLDVGGTGDTDDKLIAINVAADVPVFTATATDAQVVLEWVNPSFGDCAFVRVRARDDGLPPSVSDRLIADFACTTGARHSIPDTGLVNGNLYHYGVFVEDSTAGLTAGRFVKARPLSTVGTNHWAYSTGATSLAPPGLRLNPPASFVYAVSNDAILHSMVGGPAGGTWPGAWIPHRLGAPAQTRIPVVAFPVGSPAVNPAAFVGAQDGKVYAVDAVNGTPTWVAPIASMVQAAPAGHFSYYFPGAHDVVMTGTRNSSGPNTIEALQVHTGLPAWTYDDTATYGGTGKDMGIVSGSLTVDYANARAYFASRKGTGGNGSPDTLWCISFTASVPSHEWSIDVGNVDGAPVLYGGVLYVGNNAGVLYAVDPGGGAVNWSRNLNDGAVKGYVFPHFGEQNVFVATSNRVWSVADNGLSSTVNWSVPATTIPGPSTPTYISGTGKLLVGSSNGKLYQIDVASPLTPASVTLGVGGSVVGSPTYDIVTNTIYVGSDEGVIYALRFPLP